jgi:beta-lactamase regulating signal transducer with metallopeptidase domain
MTAIILEAALRGLIFAAAVGLGLTILRVRNVPARKAAWSLVLLASLAMPLVMRAFPQRIGWTLPIHFAPRLTTSAPVPAATLVRSIPARTEPRAARFIPTTTIDLAPIANAPTNSAPPIAHRSIHWPPVTQLLIGLYLAVTAALLIRLLYGLAVAIRLWKTALPVSPLIAPDPHVRTSSRIPSPVTIGSGIVLPAEYTQWDMRKLRMVLAHERSHVRQLDFYLQLLAGLYTAFFWFSPLGWWLRRTLSSLGEAIGDRAGIDAAASRTGYAQIVLEFAAMPHKSLPGVAMARSGNLTRRVESMLNEHLFRTSFAEGRRRALASLLLIPAALIAVALTRVPSASAQSAPPPPPPPATAPAPAAAPDPAAAPTVAPADVPALPEPAALAPPSPAGAPVAPAIPPAPAEGVGEGIGEGQSSSTDSSRTVTNGHSSNGYSYHYDTNGDSYAVVRGKDQNLTFSGDWTPDRKNQIDQARRMANGPFLWFTHDGKSYIVTDPAIIAHIEAMYAPMELLGKQQEDLGRQQEALGKQQEALGRHQELDVTVRLPDLSRELAEVDAAAASAKVEQDHIDVKQLADIEAKIKLEEDQLITPEKMAELQERLAKIQEEWTPEKIAALQEKLANVQARLGELQGQAGEKQGLLGEQMGKLGEQQGKLGEKQGLLGEQQGKLAEDLDRQVHTIIQQTLQDGKAKPVQ